MRDWCYLHYIMVRTQIQVKEAQHRRLTRYAARLGISLAEAVRRCVDAQLDQDETPLSRHERLRAALAVFGRHRDSGGETRVAQQHDRYLDAAYRT